MKIQYNGKEYTLLLEDGEYLHLIDSDGNGICILKSEL